MRILIATDAWRPQVNGVVHSIERMAAAAREQSADIVFLTPSGFGSVPMPTYPEIRLALASPRAVAERIDAADADHIHIATEGPIGFAARWVCRPRARPFTTSYHTRFPEYLAARSPVPMSWSYAALRQFHAASGAVMTPTPSMRDELVARGFKRVVVWTRGVDRSLYHPREGCGLDLPGPIFLYVGRVAVEKNVEAFLRLDLPGSKVVVGDGPAREALGAAFPAAHFLGARSGEDLARIYAGADVFVFPSRTDTFGIVLVEALASGLPVAAFPVTGPLDVIADSGAGALDADLRVACLKALAIPREKALARAWCYSWDESARQFLANIVSARSGPMGRWRPARAAGAAASRLAGAVMRRPPT
jgi:glycosyltransferase involved in cell wall biosynthesis